MDAASRRREIVALVEGGGQLRIGDLAARFGVSEMTVRRDLSRLAEEGVVARAGSGAVLRELPYEYSAEQKRRSRLRQKRAIAAFCASIVEDGETVFVDAGTTAAEVARALAGRRDITIFTNSLLAGEVLSRRARPRVIMCPGEYRERSMGYLGSLTMDFIRSYRFDTLFLGIEGITPAFGLSVPDISDCKTKAALVKASQRVVCVTDSSKFGKEWGCRICYLRDVDFVVTDSAIPDEMSSECERAGSQVMRVDTPSE
jgi:DeoR/GlpR family transcriptional regulator of sugar metabolism